MTKSQKPTGKVVIYARFSPRKNADVCESCETQIAQCQKWCAEHGVAVRAVYEDRAVSGKTEIADRNLFAAINALKKGDILLAYKRDRLSRDLMIGLQIERMVNAKGATVAVTTGEVYGNDPSADLMKKMLMVIAEWERRIIAERTRASMLMHQAQGKRMSEKVPYGYRVDPQNDRRIIKDETEQSVVAEIMRRRNGGESYWRIANALDPSTSRSGRWHMESVRRIVRRIEIGSVPIG